MMYTMLNQYSGAHKDTLERGKLGLEKRDPVLYADTNGNLGQLSARETLVVYAHGSETGFGRMTPEGLVAHLVAQGLKGGKRTIILKGCKTAYISEQVEKEFYEHESGDYTEVTVEGMEGESSQTSSDGKMTVRDKQQKAMADMMKKRKERNLPVNLHALEEQKTEVIIEQNADGGHQVVKMTEPEIRYRKRNKLKDDSSGSAINSNNNSGSAVNNSNSPSSSSGPANLTNTNTNTNTPP